MEELKTDMPHEVIQTEERKFPKKPVLIVLGVILGVLLILALFIGVPLYKTYQDAVATYAAAKEIKQALTEQDIKKASLAMTETKTKLTVVQNDLKGLGWATYLPFVGSYISDATHGANATKYGLETGEIMAKAVEPYADLLGLKGQGSAPTGTAEDRIAKLVETLDKVTPQIDAVSKKVALIEQEIEPIDPNRYPEEFAGKKIRSNLVEAKNLVALGSELLKDAKPLTKNLPTLLGARGEKRYLVLFQNDKELRPTGGFITAYAVFRVDKGRISLETSDDIYKLDDTVKKQVSPPPPIAKYLNVFNWRLRDSNFSPDFASSARTFLDIYDSSTQKKNVEGIIVMDTQALVEIMKVLGPVNIYGTNFTTQNNPNCDCPMVVYELLKQAGQPRNYWTDDRKDMIGILLQAIMKKALDAPSEMNGPLFQAGMRMTSEKHILLYLVNSENQKGIEILGFAGKIRVSKGDFLHINDANLGGAKSNLYIEQSVKQDVKITNSGADEILTIDYRYPRVGDNCSLERKVGLCLAGIFRDYLRIYLPKGAKVTEVRGFETAKPEISEDLGHAVIAGFFTVVPQGLGKIQIKYSIAGDFKAKGVYTSLIQKQPGTTGNKYTVLVNGVGEPFNLTKDKEISIKL